MDSIKSYFVYLTLEFTFLHLHDVTWPGNPDFRVIYCLSTMLADMPRRSQKSAMLKIKRFKRVKYHLAAIFKGKSVLFCVMTLTVSDFMRKNIETIPGTASIQETAKKMKSKNVSSLLVLDASEKPIGIVTERDIVRKHCVGDLHTGEVTSKEIMSSPLITIDSRSHMAVATDLMLRNNVRHLLVLDEKSEDVSKPVGMITPLDFTKIEEYSGDDEHKDSIERILEYYI